MLLPDLKLGWRESLNSKMNLPLPTSLMDQRACRARKKAAITDDWVNNDTQVKLRAKTRCFIGSDFNSVKEMKTPSSQSKSRSPSLNATYLQPRRGSSFVATATLPKAPRATASRKNSRRLEAGDLSNIHNQSSHSKGKSPTGSHASQKPHTRVQRLSINSRRTPSITRPSSARKDPPFYAVQSPDETSGVITRQKMSARYTPNDKGLVYFERSPQGATASIKSGHVMQELAPDRTPALSAKRSQAPVVPRLTPCQENLLAEYLQKLQRHKKETERLKERLNSQINSVQDLKVTELRNLRRDLESKLKEIEQNAREDLGLVERRASRLEDLEYELKYKQAR